MDYTKKFWNDVDNIDWFSTRPVSSYWLDFFKTLPNKENKKILDLGCGGGRNTEMLAKLGFDFYACDRYEGMVDATTKRLIKSGLNEVLVKSKVSQQKMDKLSFPNSFFDIIIAHGLYHNAFTEKEYDKALQESARVLKNNGLICFNIFTSKYIGTEAEIKNIKDHVYVTKDTLLMVLFSKTEFLAKAKKFSLLPFSELIEYESDVTTGKRSVLRGILIKLNN